MKIMKNNKKNDTNIILFAYNVNSIDFKMLHVWLISHWINDFVHSIIDIEIAIDHSFSSFFEMIVHIRKYDDAFFNNFIVKQQIALNHVCLAICFQKSRNILIKMSKFDVVMKFRIFWIIKICNQSSHVIRSQRHICSLISEILSYALLCQRINYWFESISWRASLNFTLMMKIHFIFDQSNFFNVCFRAIQNDDL